MSVQESVINNSEPSSSDVERFFSEGNYEELEKMVLDGKTDMIIQYSGNYAKMANFLDSVRKNQTKLDNINEAIKDGNLRKLKNLIDRKKLVLARNKEGYTALHLAVMNEHTPIINYLLQTFPECINLSDKDRRTPLHFAASLPDSNIFNNLILRGADLEAVDKLGHKPTYYKENPADLQKIFCEQKSFDKEPSIEEEILPKVLRQYVPSDEQIQRWMDEGNIEELEKLVLDGRSSLIMEKTTDCHETRDFLNALSQYQAKIDLLHKTVEEGDFRKVKSLIERSEMASAKDAHGATPLHNAILHGQTDTIRFLVSKYPECVNIMDHCGRTPLHYAVACHNSDVFVKILQKAGGDAFVEDQYGHTPFYYRSHPERLSPLKRQKSDLLTRQLLNGGLAHSLLQDLEEEIVDWLHVGNVAKLEELVLSGFGDLLLGKVAQVEDKDVLNFLEILPQYQAKIQAIHRSIEKGDLQKVRSLLDRKKLTLARDRRGATPLHKAVICKNEEITTWLLRNYPQAVNALDHNRRTPLHYAAALSATDDAHIYKLLLSANADPSLEDGYGRTARYYLHHPNDIDLDSLLEEHQKLPISHLHQRVAPSYLESSIQNWIREGNVQKLDQLVLSGCGDLLLIERPISQSSAVQAFFSNLPAYLEAISMTHKAVREGDLKTLKELMENKKLALARDRKGATPLHDALLYQQTDLVRYLVSTFPHIINAADYNKRTPMHYAAAARDGGHYYKILEKAGADSTLADKEGKTPAYYRRNPGKLDLKIILERDRDYVPDLPISWYAETEGDGSLSRSDSCVSIASTAPLNAFEDIENKASQPTISGVYGIARSAEILWPRDGVGPTTEEGQFLARTVGLPLTKALSELALVRPEDPIQFVSDFLIDYNKKMQASKQ